MRKCLIVCCCVCAAWKKDVHIICVCSHVFVAIAIENDELLRCAPTLPKEQTVHTLHYPTSRVYRVVIGVDAILFLCDAISKVKAGLFHSSAHLLILSLVVVVSHIFSFSYRCCCWLLLLTYSRAGGFTLVCRAGRCWSSALCFFWGVVGARLFALTFSIVLVLACSLSLAFFSSFPPDIKQKHFFISVIS